MKRKFKWIWEIGGDEDRLNKLIASLQELEDYHTRIIRALDDGASEPSAAVAEQIQIRESIRRQQKKAGTPSRNCGIIAFREVSNLSD